VQNPVHACAGIPLRAAIARDGTYVCNGCARLDDSHEFVLRTLLFALRCAAGRGHLGARRPLVRVMQRVLP